jgi:taurine transport system permease protein
MQFLGQRFNTKAGSRLGRFVAPVLLGLAGLVLVFLGWQAAYNAHLWSEVFVPSPAAVWKQFWLSTTNHDGQVGYAGFTLWQHLWVSLQRILVSAAIAVCIGVPLGIAIGLVPALRYLIGPWITFLRQLPPLAYFSLLIIWFGIDDTPKLILLVVAAVPPIVVATAQGITEVGPDYVLAARSLGARGLGLVRSVYLPSALPSILTGIRLGVGVAYTSVISAETVNGMPGIGGMIRDAQRYNLTSAVIVGIVALGISGLLIEGALTLLQKRLTPWVGRD